MLQTRLPCHDRWITNGNHDQYIDSMSQHHLSEAHPPHTIKAKKRRWCVPGPLLLPAPSPLDSRFFVLLKCLPRAENANNALQAIEYYPQIYTHRGGTSSGEGTWNPETWAYEAGTDSAACSATESPC